MTAAEAVANGAQLLDEKMPGWYRLIDLGTLELFSCAACVCGQLAATLYTVVDQEAEDEDFDSRYADNEFSDWAYLKFLHDKLGLESDHDHGFNETYVFSETGYTSVITFEDLDREWHKVITSRLLIETLPEPVEEKEEVFA